MSQAEVGGLIGAAIIIPFGFALAFTLIGAVRRLRAVASALYALSLAGVNIALLNGFLNLSHEPSWGPFHLTHFGFPLFLVLQLASAACVVYGGFRGEDAGMPGLLTASITAATGLAALALVTASVVAQVSLWEGVTACALIGLAVAGGGGMRRKLRAFAPWLIGDALFIAGVVLCAAWLKETSVLIAPPLTSGTEAQTVTVAALFLASALVRLGVFPFHFWIRDLVERTDATWSSFFLGTANFLLGGMRLVIVSVFLGRLVASDWGLGLVIGGLVSVLAGPVLAAIGRTVPDYVSGMYTFQAGFLLVGVGLFSRSGLEGAIFLLLVSPLFLTAGMMAAGTAEEARGTVALFRQGLSARLAPAAFVALLVSGLSLAGLPPLDGFVGKAVITLGSLDKAAVGAFYALAAGLLTAGTAVAAVAVARTVGGVFAARGVEAPAARRHSPAEGVAAVGLCAVSLLFGLFPGLLLHNFIERASRLLFASGFTGPGIAFHGTGAEVENALGLYPGWAPVVAAFVLAASALALALYFYGRATHPSQGRRDRFEPFVGGLAGDYRESSDFEFPAALARFPRRGRGR